ncbi:MAG: branched-chain amino acid ABC transporter permease [Acidimicrobiia bacterium]|nr:branched-chain amino acid ABC transporter permease [Acidimicrobiia bacterium]
MTDLAQIVLAGVSVGVIYALVAGGLTLVFGVFDVLNAAHGEYLMLGAFISFLLWEAGVHPLLTLPVSAVAMFVLGVGVQTVFVEPVLKRAPVVSFILLFGLSAVIRSVVLIFAGANDRVIFHYEGSVEILGAFLSKGRLLVLAISIPVLLGAHLYLKYSRFGVATKATAENPDVAEACGINVKMIRLSTMGVAAAIAGVAGSLVAFLFPINAQTGFTFIIISFVVAVVGGLGNFYGSILAGILVGVAQQLGSFYIASEISLGLAYAALLLTLLIRPQGIFGNRAVA